jgi:hypothetical protein
VAAKDGPTSSAWTFSARIAHAAHIARALHLPGGCNVAALAGIARAIDDRLGLTARPRLAPWGLSPSPVPRPSHHRETHHGLPAITYMVSRLDGDPVSTRPVPGQVLKRRFPIVVGESGVECGAWPVAWASALKARDLPNRRRLGEPKSHLTVADRRRTVEP